MPIRWKSSLSSQWMVVVLNTPNVNLRYELADGELDHMVFEQSKINSEWELNCPLKLDYKMKLFIFMK